MEIKEIQKTIKYKAGYEVRHELIDGKAYGCSDVILKSAYTPSGDYIGDSKLAYRLCKQWGIKPEKNKPEHCICSIGFCEKDQKWYGWSHRAMCGFGIGSEVKKGDCACVPTNLEDYIEDTIQFWSDEYHVNIKSEIIDNQIRISWDRIDSKGNIRDYCVNEDFIDIDTIKLGRGEWTAETLEDAKQMAKDYAESVS
jgi:hypothetical protein